MLFFTLSSTPSLGAGIRFDRRRADPRRDLWPRASSVFPKAALIAFLKTLTDGELLTDPRFANPFVDRKDLVEAVKRTAVTAGVMLKVVRVGTSQTPAIPELPPAPRAKSRQTMIERLMSFDRNADARVRNKEVYGEMRYVLDSLLNANDCSLPVPFPHRGHTEHFSRLSHEGTSRLQGLPKLLCLSRGRNCAHTKQTD